MLHILSALAQMTFLRLGIDQREKKGLRAARRVL